MFRKIAILIMLTSSSVAVSEPVFIKKTQELRIPGLGQGNGPVARIKQRIQQRRADRQARRDARAAAQQAAAAQNNGLNAGQSSGK